MWFYQENNQQAGPIDEEKIKSMIAEKAINGTTLVWTQSMPSWLPLNQTPLAAHLPVQPPHAGIPTPPPVTVGAPQSYYIAPPLSPSVQARSIEDLFKWWWILMAAGIPLCILIIGIPAVIASLVLYYILLYRFWDLIQDGSPRTTPGKGIGFLFIPFFSLYWKFVAIHGLAQDMNRYTRDRGIATPRVNEELALTLCILNCCTMIPYVGFLILIAALVLTILVVKEFKTTAVAILLSRE